VGNILTYGTFDLLHRGHHNILKRAALLGTNIFVGISSDEFNNWKGKTAYQNQDLRRMSLDALPYVTMTFWENSMDQKVKDIVNFDIDILVMGDDWAGSFDHLMAYCDVKYIPRTKGISSTIIRNQLAMCR
jgi:glycerol-3-phosphate cytidylyltransferase